MLSIEHLSCIRDERVLFDVVGGDFNLDNTSDVDKACHDHAIWDIYHDPCREGPGKNKQNVVSLAVFVQSYIKGNYEMPMYIFRLIYSTL